jgi:hypothetical protein
MIHHPSLHISKAWIRTFCRSQRSGRPQRSPPTGRSAACPGLQPTLPIGNGLAEVCLFVFKALTRGAAEWAGERRLKPSEAP